VGRILAHEQQGDGLRSAPAEAGSLDVRGFLRRPARPGVGWRTVVETIEEDSLHMIMYNVTPAGQEVLAVDAVYRRAD
jgi:Protein of unknown function (DUF1579)